MARYNICYLTDGITSLESSSGDKLLIDYLEMNDISVEMINWKNQSQFDQFDLVMVRTTWDYIHYPDQFREKLLEIDSQTKLINPLATLLWNMNKTYLIELNQKGISTIPTETYRELDQNIINEIFYKLDQGHGIIVKPTIGAGSQGIQHLMKPQDFKPVATGNWFIQPFINSIQTLGEYSLFYFGGKFSHAINKLPKPGDFRSQEEFGSNLSAINPSEKMKELASKALANLDFPQHYARVDLLLDTNNDPLLIELEMIEPSLYFNYAQNGAELFGSHIIDLLSTSN